ncbi:MAG TPA: arabinofuranosidase catalytic domain-containing protein [Polyangiaceae bacterium]|nr:arabinofuranosidase catalytic domain-containing protein [Polyangiaceae bacterium]
MTETSRRTTRLEAIGASVMILLVVDGCGKSGSDLSEPPGSGGSTTMSRSSGAPAFGGALGSGGATTSTRSGAGESRIGSGGTTVPFTSLDSRGSTAANGGTSTNSSQDTTGGGNKSSEGNHRGGASGTGSAVVGAGASSLLAKGGAANGGSMHAGTTGGDTGAVNPKGPCDIYQAENSPCVAAHSTVRALYAAYNGKLYQVRRADKALQDIGVLSPGGIADASVQEDFCANTKCTISKIYDQSPMKNDLTLTSGGWIGDRAKEVDAFGIKIKLNGKTVYGIHITGETNMTGNGYRNNAAVGTAKNDEPESMYMVANGKNFNDKCCFDYGNAETNSLNNGPATMEAIYFGNCTAWGKGEGTGPWVMADLEEGLFSGKNRGLNPGVMPITSDYVTAMLKGKPSTMAIKAGNSQSGPLTKIYQGAYPSGYDPMKKEGAIVLGTGGDNSFAAVGDFFEGAMTAGYATDAADDAVQSNIVAAGYGR